MRYTETISSGTQTKLIECYADNHAQKVSLQVLTAWYTFDQVTQVQNTIDRALAITETFDSTINEHTFVNYDESDTELYRVEANLGMGGAALTTKPIWYNNLQSTLFGLALDEAIRYLRG